MTLPEPMSRRLTSAEKSLVDWILARRGDAPLPGSCDLDRCRVRVIDDTGSLRFLHPDEAKATGRGSPIYSFMDTDGIPFTAFLTYDILGRVAELDLGKVDYSDIVRLPSEYNWKLEQTQRWDD